MGFVEPNGRIIVNSRVGFTGIIKETNRNTYVFPDIEVCSADEPRQYRVGENFLYVNPFSGILKILDEIDF